MEEGTAECTKCPVNTYLDVENQSTCKPCPAGSYQVNTERFLFQGIKRERERERERESEINGIYVL